jgi:glutaredoxin 3
MATESRAMPKITIYTTPICPYCVRAKALLRKKGAAFDEVDVFMDSTARDEMEARAKGRRTVPQIFIGERHVGGCDELYSLDSTGELDPLLSAA